MHHRPSAPERLASPVNQPQRAVKQPPRLRSSTRSRCAGNSDAAPPRPGQAKPFPRLPHTPPLQPRHLPPCCGHREPSAPPSRRRRLSVPLPAPRAGRPRAFVCPHPSTANQRSLPLEKAPHRLGWSALDGEERTVRQAHRAVVASRASAMPEPQREQEQSCPPPLLPPPPAMRCPASPPSHSDLMEALQLGMPCPQTGAFLSTPRLGRRRYLRARRAGCSRSARTVWPWMAPFRPAPPCLGLRRGARERRSFCFDTY